MPASASPRATLRRHARRDVRIVHRLGAVGAEVVDGQPAPAQVLHERALQRHAGVVAGDRHAPDVGWRRQSAGSAASTRAGADHRDAPRRQRVLRQRRDVPARRRAPPSRRLELPASASVMISKRFMRTIRQSPIHRSTNSTSLFISTAMYGRLRYFSA